MTTHAFLVSLKRTPRRTPRAEPDAGVGPQSERGRRVDAAIAELEVAATRALLASLKGPYLMEVPR